MSLLLYNGVIHGEENSYILIKGNRIEAIGRGGRTEASRKIDVNGAMILPGFCDSHTHLSNLALQHGTLDLTNLSREDVLRLVEDECRKRRVVVGRGWDESFWRDKRYLTSEELDSICPNSLVFLIREDGHLAVVNSAARKRYGLGDEEGILREDEVSKMAKLLKVFENLDFQYAMDYALSKGITCVHDFVNLQTLKSYFELHRHGNLKIRICANFYENSFDFIVSLGLHSGFGDEFLKIGGLKLFSDGSIGAKTAATEYVDGTIVNPILNRRKIKSYVEKANSLGIKVLTHAIGDLAIEEVIHAYGGNGFNRIEHFELARDEHFIRGLEVSMQPNFLKWAKKGGLYERMLGPEWLERNNAYRRILNEGVNLLFGSDCMPMDPLFGIKMATGSEYPLQRISFDEAVRAYTAGSSYLSDKLGRVKEGYLADIVAVDSRGVLLTIVDGQIAYMRALSHNWGIRGENMKEPFL